MNLSRDYRILGVVFSLLLLLPANRVSPQNIPSDDEESFTTADALRVRSHPGTSAAIVGIIPYGTQISYTIHSVKADGHDWVFSKQSGGYIAKTFLSSSVPKEKKEMILKSSEYVFACLAGVGNGSKATITLSHGVFHFSLEYAQTAEDDLDGRGSYEISEGMILLRLTSLSKKYPTNPSEKTQLTSAKAFLIYNGNLGGYVLDKHRSDQKFADLLPVISVSDVPANLHGILNRGECSIEMANCPKKPSSNPNLDESKSIGYFCLKARP